MTTTIVSIGSRSDTVDTETPAGFFWQRASLRCYFWNYSLREQPLGIWGLWILEGSDEDYESASDYEFVVTAISGANITLKYLRDSGSTGDHSPLGLYDWMLVVVEVQLQAPMVFKRHGLPTAHNYQPMVPPLLMLLLLMMLALQQT